MAILHRLRAIWVKAAILSALSFGLPVFAKLAYEYVGVLRVSQDEPTIRQKQVRAEDRRDKEVGHYWETESRLASLWHKTEQKGFEAIDALDKSFWARGSTTWYASPSGSGNLCTNASPCNLNTAMCGSGTCTYARANDDTIILKNGTYTVANGGYGNNISIAQYRLGGISGHPITYTAETWRSVTLDCRATAYPVTTTSGPTIACLTGEFSDGKWLTVKNLIFDNSSTVTRSIAGADDAQDNPGERGIPFAFANEGLRAEHCIFKHGTNGVQGDGGYGAGNSGYRRFYWNLNYYQGYHWTDRGHGHSMYAQSAAQNAAEALLMDYNVGWRNGDVGIQIYTAGGLINYVTLDHNVEFLDGIGTGGAWLTTVGRATIWIGGTGTVCTSSKAAQSPIITNNETWDARASAEGNKFGVTAGFKDLTATGNYFASHGTGFLFATGTPCDTNTVVDSNTIYGTLSNMTCNQYGTNTCPGATLPTSGQRKVYQTYTGGAGEGRLILYNWNSAATVTLDPNQLGGYTGEQYEIRTNNAPTGAAIATGTWDGSSLITLNTTGYTVEAPTGDWPTPNESGLSGGMVVYMFEPAAAATTPTPTNTPTNTQTFTPSATRTNTPSYTRTPTYTPSQTATPSVTPSQSATASPTFTPTATVTPTLTKSATPTSTPTPSSISTLTFEAEQCTVAAPMVKVTDAAVFGGQYVASPTTSQGQLTCTVTVATTGTYRVWTRVYGADTTHDSFYLDLDADGSPNCVTDGNTTCTHIFDTASSLGPCDGILSNAVDKQWARWIWNPINDRSTSGLNGCTGEGNERQLTLSAGVHVLTFRQRDPSTRLDRIVLTTDMSYEPSDLSLTPTPTPTASCHIDLCNGRAKPHCSVPHAKTLCPWTR